MAVPPARAATPTSALRTDRLPQVHAAAPPSRAAKAALASAGSKEGKTRRSPPANKNTNDTRRNTCWARLARSSNQITPQANSMRLADSCHVQVTLDELV
eukprot:6178143-Pleurochrysis_carterae.AAC.1